MALKRDEFKDEILKIQKCETDMYCPTELDDPCAECRTNQTIEAYDAVIRGIKKELEAKFEEFAHTSRIESGYEDAVNEWNRQSDRWQEFWQKYGGE